METEMYVVVDSSDWFPEIFYNESGNEDYLMNLEDATYTANHLAAKVYKLVEVEL